MSKEILVVDDSPDARALVIEALAPVGYRVCEAEDGRDGLEQLERMPLVCAVLLDINMPVMNGIEMLREVRRNPKYESLPIVMLTSEANPEAVSKARSAGATAWLQKPVSPKNLRLAMDALTKAQG